MEREEIKEIIKKELPEIIKTDDETARFIIRLSTQYCAPRIETEDRFNRILNELERDRQTQNKRWEEQNRKWEEQNRKWEEQNKKWEEQNKKWEENQRVIEGMLDEIRTMNRRYDQGIGALGARWGLHSEASFRNALKGILEDSFGVEVLHVNEFDDQGVVFGKPDQVEIDIIIKDGLLIVCEIKSSMSRADMYIFERKVRFYEKRHGRKADRIMVISPMVEDRAKEIARQFGIEVYSYADDVKNI